MFNFSEVKASLTVTPEVSPSLFANYYTKEETDNKFVQEVPQTPEGTVYGRKYGEWETIGSTDVLLYCGYSNADNPQQVVLTELTKYPNSDSDNVTFAKNNTSENNRFWVCSIYPISSISIIGLPVPYEDMGTMTVPYPTIPTEFHYYRTGNLQVGNYSFIITVNRE